MNENHKPNRINKCQCPAEHPIEAAAVSVCQRRCGTYTSCRIQYISIQFFVTRCESFTVATIDNSCSNVSATGFSERLRPLQLRVWSECWKLCQRQLPGQWWKLLEAASDPKWSRQKPTWHAGDMHNYQLHPESSWVMIHRMHCEQHN